MWWDCCCGTHSNSKSGCTSSSTNLQQDGRRVTDGSCMVCARGYRALQAHSGLVRESCLPRSPPGRRDVQPGLDVCTHTLPDRSRPNRTTWTAAGVCSVPFAPIHRRVLLAEGTEGEAQRVRGGARDTETGAFTFRFHWTPVEHRFFLGGNARTGTYTRATPPTSKLKEAMGVPAQVVRILISEPKRDSRRLPGQGEGQRRPQPQGT